MKSIYFEILLLSLLIAIFGLTNPQINLALDSDAHVSVIMHLIRQGEAYMYSPEFIMPRHAWHSLWALILKPFMPISVFHVFKIIYIIQFILTVLLIYVSSKIIIKNVYPDINIYRNSIGSAGATVLYVFSTSLLGFSWVTMYMVSYLITMAVTIYLIAWSIDNFNERLIRIKTVIVFILCLSVILFIHGAEFSYFIVWCAFFMPFILNKIRLRAVLFILCVVAIFILLLVNVRLFSGSFISLNEYRQVYAHDNSNINLPVTEIVWFSVICFSFFILAISLFRAKFRVNIRLLLVIYIYSCFMIYITYNVQARELLFFIRPHITARFIYGSLWFIFIPITIIAILAKVRLRVFLPLFPVIFLVVFYGIYIYSKGHEKFFSNSVHRLIISYDPDVMGRFSQKDFEIIESYVSKYNAKETLFIANDDIAAAIGITGYSSNYDYHTFTQMTPVVLGKYTSTYKLVIVPNIIPLNSNPKNFNLWLTY